MPTDLLLDPDWEAAARSDSATARWIDHAWTPVASHAAAGADVPGDLAQALAGLRDWAAWKQASLEEQVKLAAAGRAPTTPWVTWVVPASSPSKTPVRGQQDDADLGVPAPSQACWHSPWAWSLARLASTASLSGFDSKKQLTQHRIQRAWWRQLLAHCPPGQPGLTLTWLDSQGVQRTQTLALDALFAAALNRRYASRLLCHAPWETLFEPELAQQFAQQPRPAMLAWHLQEPGMSPALARWAQWMVCAQWPLTPDQREEVLKRQHARNESLYKVQAERASPNAVLSREAFFAQNPPPAWQSALEAQQRAQAMSAALPKAEGPARPRL